ncbi:hypothetical protein Tco_1578456 [Tanacetum coccineum]
MHAPLKERFRDLPEADMKEIIHNRMWESKSYQTHEDHMTLYEALEKSMARDNRDQLLSDLAEARKKKKKRQGSPKTPSGSPPHPPPPPPPPAGPSGTSGASGASGSSQSPPPPPPPSNTQGGQSTSTAAPSSSKTAALAEYTAWTMTDTRIKPSVSPIPEELHMGDDTTADEQAYSSSGEDVGRDHIPTVNLRQSWWKPITEDRPATPEPAWSIPSSDLTVPTNNWASALKSTYTPPPENSLLAQIGDMATFMDWYCKKQGISELTQKDLEGPAYEIVKVFHPDVMWIEEECKYERRLAMMGISHGGSKTTDSYIDRHTSARFSLARQRYETETGFSDNARRRSARDMRATRRRTNMGYAMIMRFNESTSSVDGTLHQINESVDYRVQGNYRATGRNTRVLDTWFFETRKTSTEARSLCLPYRNHLRHRRIFRNLESFVGGRIRDGDYQLLKRIEC